MAASQEHNRTPKLQKALYFTAVTCQRRPRSHQRSGIICAAPPAPEERPLRPRSPPPSRPPVHVKPSCGAELEISLLRSRRGPSLHVNTLCNSVRSFPKAASLRYYFSLQEMPIHKLLQGQRTPIQVMLGRQKIRIVASLGRGRFSFRFQTSSQRPLLSHQICKEHTHLREVNFFHVK